MFRVLGFMVEGRASAVACLARVKTLLEPAAGEGWRGRRRMAQLWVLLSFSLQRRPMAFLGFGVWGLGFGVWGLGFGVWVWGLGFRVWGLGFKAQGSQGLGFSGLHEC